MGNKSPRPNGLGLDAEDMAELDAYLIDRIHKISLVGAEQVGKSTYLKMLTQDPSHNINAKYQPTIGCEFGLLTIPDLKCKLQIWDLGGQERFRSIGVSYIRSNSIAIFMYSVNHASSWEELKTYYVKLFREMKGPDAPGLLIGNLTDKNLPVQVHDADVQAYATENSLFSCTVDLSTATAESLVHKVREVIEKLDNK